MPGIRLVPEAHRNGHQAQPAEVAEDGRARGSLLTRTLRGVAGAVTQRIPHADLDDRVLEYAAAVAEHSPISIEGTGVVVDAVVDPGNEALRREALAFEHRAASSADYLEGIKAFLEKRKPVFSGR